MKKILCLLLVCLLLAGCRAAPAETTAAPTQTQIPENTTTPDEDAAKPQEGKVAFANPGKVRLTYTENRNFVHYVTSPEDLPDEEALAGYDAAYFENKALLIVVQTVNSGSVQLEIEAINLSGDIAAVSVRHSMDGEIGTSDMATWMLWVEVEKELDYTWTIEGLSEPPQGEKY